MQHARPLSEGSLMSDDTYNFDRVLRELQIEKAQLESLIEEGEIQAYREGSALVFRKEDIENYKNYKMVQPTITVHSRGEDEPMMMDEFEEEEISDNADDNFLDGGINISQDEDEDEEQSGSQIGMEDESYAEGFQITDEEDAEPPHSSVAPPKAAPAPAAPTPPASPASTRTKPSPILDIYGESTKAPEISYESMKEEGDELVFERETGGEEMLEPGENLFESQEELPRDREIDELFTESEIGLAPSFESRENRAASESWGMAEDTGEEDIVGTPLAQSGFRKSQENKKARKLQTYGIITTAVLVFTVLTVFIINSGENTGIPSIAVAEISKVTMTRPYEDHALLEPSQALQINAPIAGVIGGRSSEKSLVQKDAILAQIAKPQEGGSRSEQEASLKKIKDEMGVVNDYERTYKAQSSAKKEYGESDERFKKAETEYREVLRKYNQITKAYSVSGKRSAKVKAIKKVLSEKEEEIQKNLERMKESPAQSETVEIKAPEEGMIRKWEVEEKDSVEKEKILCEFLSTEKLSGTFRSISMAAGRNLKEKANVDLKYENRTVSGTIQKLYQQATKPPMMAMEVSIDNADKSLKAQGKVTFQHTEESEALGIPVDALLEDGNEMCIIVVEKDSIGNKTFKRKVKVLKDPKSLAQGELLPIASEMVKIGDKIALPGTVKLQDLKDDQHVKIKKD